MASRLGQIDGLGLLGNEAHEPFAALHVCVVDGLGVEALGGIELERAVLAADIDRGDLGDHLAGDLADDAIEPRLAAPGLRHNLAQPPDEQAGAGIQLRHVVSLHPGSTVLKAQRLERQCLTRQVEIVDGTMRLSNAIARRRPVH